MDDITKLTIILYKFEQFSKAHNNIYAKELRECKEKLEDHKINICEPELNGHYISCGWSDPKPNQTLPDTCKCVFMKHHVSYWCKDIVKLVGVDYITNSI